MQNNIAVHDTDKEQGNVMNSNPNHGNNRKEKQMHAITRTTLAAVLVALSLSLTTWSAETPPVPNNGAAKPVPPPQRSIGFRGDGSGVFADAKPPVTADEKTGANIRWKVALPNWGSAQPLVVGTKVFVVCEPGWSEDQDFPLLLCLDADTGKELWRKSLDHLPAMIADENARAEVAAKWHGALRDMRAMYTELNAGKGKPDFDAKAVKARYGKGTVMTGVQPLLKYGLIMDNWWKAGCGLYCVGSAYPTPCSDGERIYVATGLQSFWCLDLDGNVQWMKADPVNLWWNNYGGNDFCKAARSPLLYGDLFISDVAGKVRAYDRKTGELRWSLGTPKAHEDIVSPAVITANGKDFLLYGSEGAIAAALLPAGKAVPVKDWKTAGGIMLVKRDERDVVFFSGSGDHVHWADKQTLGPAAARFSYDEAAGELKGQLLWGGVDGKNITGNERVAIVYHDGRLYHNAGVILDTTTGKLLAGSVDRRTPRAAPDTKSLLAVAGDHVYGLVDSNQGHFGGTPPPGLTGRLTAYTLDGKKAGEVVLTNAPVEGEKARQIASQNQFPVWGFSYCPTFTPAGDRLYVRSNDYLWCLGEK